MHDLIQFDYYYFSCNGFLSWLACSVVMLCSNAAQLFDDPVLKAWPVEAKYRTTVATRLADELSGSAEVMPMWFVLPCLARFNQAMTIMLSRQTRCSEQ